MSPGRTVALLGIVLQLFAIFLAVTPDPLRALFGPTGVVMLSGLFLGLAGVWIALDEELPENDSG